MMTIVCYLVLSRIPSIHDFYSIIMLFSDHMLDAGVLENNRVTLSKSRMEGTRDINQATCNSRHSQAVQNTLDNSETMHLTSYYEMHHSEWVTQVR
jgi:hypothetical protein